VAWGTGGHTDEFVRFADARTVLLAWPDAAEAARHPVTRLNLQRMQRNFEILSAATDVQGRPLRVLKLPLPRIIERRVFLSAAADTTFSRDWTAASFPRHERRREGDWVMQVASASYLNFVVANGVVVLPDYLPHGTPRAVQQRVQADVEQAFPGRVVHWVDAVGANWVGGGAHCASLSEPRV
jgi:agmatine deiminase